MRRGSPLPIPNRVVKPACADGTAVMWESMSSPFFNLNPFQILNPSSIDEGFFVIFIFRILPSRVVAIFSLMDQGMNGSSLNVVGSIRKAGINPKICGVTTIRHKY